ncbi:MAG TPA: helicase-related protein [Acetobacteraceae bacterium]|nr:helicase-related protein [Acetobacteraceae bacterium]
MQFLAGSRVAARGLAWDVVETQPLGAQQRLRLRCAGGDLRGLEWDILYPNEPVEPLHAALRPDIPGPLTGWRLHHIACLLEQVPGPEEVLATEPGRVTIEPYQLVPLMRALEMPRPRLLLADAVGLGKTVQAGLIATELIARRRAHRILVVSPPGPLLTQWHYELRDRFGLRFTIIADTASLQRERRRTELGGNPFDGIALCLVSLDFAKQERVLEELERAAWDLAIIDEAHHCIAAGPGADSDDTLRRRLAEVVARRCDGLLLLTATPHDGYDAHFASLIELLDPSLVDGRGGLAGAVYRRHVVRRLKSHIRDPATGAPLFRERKVLPVRIEQSGAIAAPGQAFHSALAALVAPRLRRARHSGDAADMLTFVGLLKRSVSTIGACVATLQVVAERYRALRQDPTDSVALQQERTRALRAFRRRRLRFGALDTAAEATAAALEAEDMAADLHRFGAEELATGLPLPQQHDADAHDADAIVQALQELIRLGAAAEPHDPKLHALADEVRLIRAAHPAANILVYTEYADSQAAAVHALSHAKGIGGCILAISGLDPEAERTRIAERCAREDNIVLLSTDSMAEGLNLHQRCHHLIHLDLPYNPNRLEQRNGRIDRYGQTHDPEIRYLYLAGTFEQHLLLRLIAKYEKARACLDLMPDTLGVTADLSNPDTGLVAGFAERQAGLFQDDVPAIRTLDVAAETNDAAALHDLMHEIDRAFAGYERHAARHGWLADQGLNADLRQAGAADAARQRSEALAGHIDLAEFVAAAIEAEDVVTQSETPVIDKSETPVIARREATKQPRSSDVRPVQPQSRPGLLRRSVPRHDSRVGNSGRGEAALTLPPDWTAGLDGLPGYDAATRTLRLTRDRTRLCDADGKTLAFLGRAHPLVRRAISRVHHAGVAQAAGISDPRVSIARRDSDEPAALLTFCIEIAGARRTRLQRILAVLLPRSGPAVALPQAERWLDLAAGDRTIAPDDPWQRWFAAWLPRRQPLAEKLATASMRRIAADCAAAQRCHAARDRIDLERWLKLRADEICGVFVPRTADLFAEPPDRPAWKSVSAPLDRLAAFASEAANAPAARREANSVLTLFRNRSEEAASDGTPSPPSLRLFGMLLLVP